LLKKLQAGLETRRMVGKLLKLEGGQSWRQPPF
jgi:hypothetical protein